MHENSPKEAALSSHVISSGNRQCLLGCEVLHLNLAASLCVGKSLGVILDLVLARGLTETAFAVLLPSSHPCSSSKSEATNTDSYRDVQLESRSP